MTVATAPSVNGAGPGGPALADRLALLSSLSAAEKAYARTKTAEGKELADAKKQFLRSFGYVTGYLDGMGLLEPATHSGFAAILPDRPTGAESDDPFTTSVAALRSALEPTRGPAAAIVVGAIGLTLIVAGEIVNACLD